MKVIDKISRSTFGTIVEDLRSLSKKQLIAAIENSHGGGVVVAKTAIGDGPYLVFTSVNFDFVPDEEETRAYKAEVERRRQIGLTIDPATAETTFWWADSQDPYRILSRWHQTECIGREHFARHPGADDGDWVDFGDLPEATRDALWERDKRKLSFPYGLHPDDDVINYPPGHKEKLPSD